MALSRSPLVCLVEPDPDVREFIEGMLRKAGYQCASFISAERFEHFAESTRIGCVIADVQLPGIDGLELARRVRSHLPSVPVMLLTADEDHDTERAASIEHLAQVQRKPLSVHAFMHAVAAATGRA